LRSDAREERKKCVALGSIDPHGVAFTGEGTLVRQTAGYENEKLKPRYPTSGSWPARAERSAPFGSYRWPTDFSDEANLSVAFIASPVPQFQPPDLKVLQMSPECRSN
jgi:hypothetical protein